jgi:hypothetical protein
MTPERTPEGKQVIYTASNGQRVVRWPVDARSMLATGAYTTDPLQTADADTVSVTPGLEREALPASPDLPLLHSPGVPLVAMAATELRAGRRRK